MSPERLKVLARRMTIAATRLKQNRGWAVANSAAIRWTVWASEQLDRCSVTPKTPKREVCDASDGSACPQQETGLGSP